MKDGKVSESRLDTSVRRILDLKELLGLLDNPNHLLDDFPEVEKSVGSDVDKAKALKLARESIVLLENDGILPLDRSTSSKIFVTGRNCHSLGHQVGRESRARARDVMFADPLMS